MKTLYYKISDKFTKCPGGRYRDKSDKSGQEFREDVIEGLVNNYDEITFDLNDVIGFPPSFLDEAFGTFVKRLGRKQFKQKFKFVITNNDITTRALERAIENNSET